MTDKQSAKWKMYLLVLQILKEQQALFAGIPVFENLIKELEEICNQIKIVTEEQEKKTLRGTSNLKNEAEIRLVTETVKIGNVLSVLATDLNDKILLSKTIVNKSMMYHALDTEALNIARRILKEALANAGNLRDYGLNDNDIQSLQNVINEYEPLIIAPRAVVSKTKQITANLAHIFADADTLLNDRLDKLMSIFKTSAPDFYAEYFNSRNVINTSARKKPSDTTKEEGTEESNE